MKPKLNLNIGELLEPVGAAMGVWACGRYFGLSGALVAIAVLSIVAAELLYDDVVVHIPLPPVGRWAHSASRAITGLLRWAGRTAKHVVVR